LQNAETNEVEIRLKIRSDVSNAKSGIIVTRSNLKSKIKLNLRICNTWICFGVY